MKLQIFITFHKYIFDECYENISEEDLKKYFTFIAVNPKYEKHYNKDKYKVINEWELPIYDKTFQERGYNENSAIYHIYANNLHKDYDFIGFFQYDMKFLQKDTMQHIITSFEKNPKTRIEMCSDTFWFCAVKTWGELDSVQFILNDYQRYMQKAFDQHKRFPIYNSYIIPIDSYNRIMKWLVQFYDKFYPEWVSPPHMSHWGHLSGIYERIMAFAVGNEDLVPVHLDVEHNHEKWKYKSYPDEEKQLRGIPT